MSLSALALALAAGNLALIAYVLHKVRRIYLMLFDIKQEILNVSGKHLLDLTLQLQAMDWLSTELQLKKSLPPTRGWAASPDFLQVIAKHALKNRPHTILECGSGTSTVVLARCLQLNGSGHLYSLDHQPEYAATTKEHLADYGLQDWATVINAPLVELSLLGATWTWYDVALLPEGDFDMLVIDGPPWPVGSMVRYPAGPLLFPRLRSQGFAFVDDALREQAIVARWRREHPKLALRTYPCEKGCVSLSLQAER
jgi:predicted O-methyltransferase YrrM